MSEQGNLTGKGMMISSAKLVNGELTDIRFKGDTLNMLEFARALVDASMQSIPRVQRPLQRKFDTILEKLAALQKDVSAELETRSLRNQEKLERECARDCEKYLKQMEKYRGES